MSTTGNISLQPTWFGHVYTAKDALVLFEACLNGTLHHVPRRPHDRERSTLIQSGSVFIYEENASGIKRWTDGVPWSPSRILGNFLVYRELVKPFPPGEKKRATKKSNRPTRATKPGEPYPRPAPNGSPTSPIASGSNVQVEGGEMDRSLIGSLVDSYGFKEDGLVKKTMSVNVRGVHHHLVSYYNIADASANGKLKVPTDDPRLKNIIPRDDLILRQSFRSPIENEDEINYHEGLTPHPGNYLYGGQYAMPGPHSGVTAPLNMNYHGAHLSSTGFSPGIQNFSSAQGIHQSFYATGPAMSPPLRQDGYSSYNGNGNGNGSGSNGYNNNDGNHNNHRPAPLSITTERRSSVPHASTLLYRNAPPTPLSALPALGGSSQSQDVRFADCEPRGAVTPSVHYTPVTLSQPHSAGPYSTHNHQWNGIVAPSHSLPRLGESSWPESNWSLSHPGSGRTDHYTVAQQHNV